MLGPAAEDGETLLSCSKDGAVRMWRVATLEPLASLPMADALSAVTLSLTLTLTLTLALALALALALTPAPALALALALALTLL